MTDSTTSMQELEETVGRLSAHKGVEAVLMLNRHGDILVSSGGASGNAPAENQDKPKQAKYLKQVIETATKFIHCLDPEDAVSFVQIRSKQHEVMLAPHNDYILAVLQDPLVAAPSTI